MELNLTHQAADYRQRHKRASIWKKITMILASVVVFCTTYALILPAITLEQDTVCGLEEHTHGETCYTAAPAIAVTELFCDRDTLNLHSHDETCLDENHLPACGYADFVLHRHDTVCYDGDGRLQCTLPEISAHIHGQDCWQQPHAHGEACYTAIQGELSCPMAEGDTHSHIATCYTARQDLICAQPEVAGHTHGDACKTVTTTLICQLSEAEGHAHDAACLDETGTLVCEKEATEGHAHGSACYETAETMTCSLSEQEGHTHDDGCYQTAYDLTCDLSDTEPHVHGDGCYLWTSQLTCEELTAREGAQPTLICKLDEIIAHTHTADCFDSNGVLLCGLVEVTEHLHQDACVEVSLIETDDLVLVCTKAIHEHSEDCIAPRETTEGILTVDKPFAENLYCDVAEHTHQQENCFDENGFLMCTMTEHRHSEECYVKKAAPPILMLAPRAPGNINLSNYVITVHVQHRAEDETVWQDVVDGKVQTGDALRFDILYKIPGGELDANNRTVIYQVPITATKAENGYVYNGDDIVGTYTITNSGLISIVFNEDYATKNASGADISGHIAFESSVDSLDSDSNGKVEVAFKETIKLQIEGKVNNTADLQVEKTAANINRDAGTVDYTITVTSENGTSTPVKLNDVMSGVTIVNGTFTVKDQTGGTFDISPSIDRNGNFTMELPGMESNGVYTITYTAVVPDINALNGTMNVYNKVDVESNDGIGGVLVDEDRVDTAFERTVISKTGKLENGIITWTIVVNTSKVDIGGWTLTDRLSGREYKGEVSISPHPGTGQGTFTTELPYTFPENSRNTYTVVYTTTVEESQDLGNTHVNNTATLTPPDGNGISDGDTVIIQNDYDPLTKEATGVALNGKVEAENHLADFHWKVVIDASAADIEPGTHSFNGVSKNVWYYGDELWNEDKQWITGAQLKELNDSLSKNNCGQYEILAYRWDGTGSQKYRDPVSLAQVADTAKYAQFRILFYEKLPMGQKIEFTYATTGNVGSGSDSVSLTNRGDVNGKVFDQVSQSYNPVVTKVDKEGGKSEDTYHDLNDAHLSDTAPGILGWNITVTLPKMTYTQDVVITENLPAGTKLLNEATNINHWDLSIENSSMSGGGDFDVHKQNGSTRTITVNGVQYIVTAAKLSDTCYTITLPKELATVLSGTTFRLQVRVKIDDNLDWSTASKTFENVVTVTHGEVPLGQASQSQIIRNPILSKSSGEILDNVIPYSLEINPGGADLVSGSDTLTLTDILTHSKSASGTVNAVLLMNSVKVYELRADDTRTDITVQCPYTSTEAETDGKISRTITMTVPDGKRLLVEYSYRISGTIGAEVELTNTASIEGYSDKVDEDDTKLGVTIQQSNAGATLVGVKIVKVDAENYNLHLEGAVFRLDKWNGTEYVSIKTYTTQEDGTIQTEELEEDVAYRLVETASPYGYAIDPTPYEFMISRSGSGSQPESFDGKILNNGDSIIISNREYQYELPETGGAGTIPYTAGGVLLMALPLLVGLRRRRRREADG